jgi:hypothetical protein
MQSYATQREAIFEGDGVRYYKVGDGNCCCAISLLIEAQFPRRLVCGGGKEFLVQTLQKERGGQNILKFICIPASVEKFGGHGFVASAVLQTIVFESVSQLLSLPKDSFAGCYSLSSICLPSSCVVLSSHCFYYSNLVTMFFEDASPGPAIGRVTGSFEDNAFTYSKLLTCISIPSFLSTLCEGCFRNCLNLSVVSFQTGSKLSSIGKNAFSNCKSLTSILLPSFVETLNKNCFGFCDIFRV